MEVLLEELYVDDGLEGLLGKSPSELQIRQYPGAVATALILRHSWRADDLACILERLGMTNGRKSTLPLSFASIPTAPRITDARWLHLRSESSRACRSASLSSGTWIAKGCGDIMAGV
jgi:hypothetical protein